MRPTDEGLPGYDDAGTSAAMRVAIPYSGSMAFVLTQQYVDAFLSRRMGSPARNVKHKHTRVARFASRKCKVPNWMSNAAPNFTQKP